MQKKIIIAALVAFLSPVIANASCDSVVEEITQKIINNGVPEDSFTVVVVSNEEAASQQGTIVGNCSNETQQIIYTKK
ncbi:Xaa-Pro aminopeptidase [Providencia alcalifaciens]|nr:Xaa-Pro aminopeptidase [Providencia alcalifaciens]